MKKRKHLFPSLILIGAVLVLAACGQAATRDEAPASTSTSLSEPTEATGQAVTDPTSAPSTSTPVPPLVQKITSDTPGEVGSLAPELTGIAGWINAEPFTLESLRGQVVLIDFWTYTCVNCLRTFPFLKEWQEKYADRGLNIIGVHTPEFEFEKTKANVEDAVSRIGLKWRMAQDNDMKTWRAYNNRFWPAKYLIDATGVIRYRHFGEGAYEETERQIRELLEEIGVDLSDITVSTEQGPGVDPGASTTDRSLSTTRELYAGIQRNISATVPYYGNNQFYYVPAMTPAFYEDPGDHANHFLYLHGAWINGMESIMHAQETENLDDYIALKIFATSVNVVIASEDAEPYDVVITLDGLPVEMEAWGADLRLNGEGMTVIRVDEPRMYGLLELPAFGGHELKLSSNSQDFNVFAFTFGSYVQGP
ncbi:MAG: redoxin domain-containing protein [Chloroflexi bacterium]|nr:redoxin domain-containing protein [Chloroflexota bacterium]